MSGANLNMLQILQKKVDNEERWYREEKLKEENKKSKYNYEKDEDGIVLPRDKQLKAPQ